MSKPITPAPSQILHRVQVGAYKVLANAKAMEARLKKDGYATYMIKTTSGLYRVQTGAFAVKDNAVKLERELKAKGYATYLTTNAVNDAGPVEKVEEAPKPTTPAPLKVGDRVKIRKGAKSYTGGGLASFVYNNVYTIGQLKGDRAVVGLTSINTPVNIKDLIKQ